MDWQDALRARAKDAGLAGGNVEWRERRGRLPAVVLMVVSDPRPQHLKGFHERRESRVQVDCWAETRAGAVTLSEAAIAALVPAGAFSGINFGRGMIGEAGVRDLGETTESGFVHRDSFDLLVWHD